MPKSSLCDYSDAYILITVNKTGTAAAPNKKNKKVMFKNCASFTNCISKINNTQIDNTKDIDIVILMYNLIEYHDNYSKTSGSLWQHCKNIPAVNNGNIIVFNGTNATDSFNSKVKITGQTDNDGEIHNVQIMVALKYLRNFWKIVEMSLINCEVNRILTSSANCVILYTDVANKVLHLQ